MNFRSTSLFRLFSAGVLAASALSLSSGAAAESLEKEYLQILQQARSDIIVPAHAQLSAKVQALKAKTTALCEETNAQSLEHAQQAWREAMQTWMSVSLIQFGPLQEQDRRLRMQSWPIREKLLERAVEALASGSDPLQAAINNGSIAIQGLPAIEYLLFGKNALDKLQSADQGARRCQALTAIASHSVDLATELEKEWKGGFGDNFENPFEADGNLSVPQESVDEYLNGLMTGIQQITANKVATPMGLEGRSAKLKALESFHSRNSIANIRNNLSALRRFYMGGDGYGLDDFLLSRESAAMHKKITGLLDGVDAQLAQIDFALEDAVNDAEKNAKVKKLYEALRQLQAAVEKELFPVIGVTRDFNSEDGD
ncbi:predicted periplasmic lipoprotein [Hahella chejuensis KCTC 2396]|uniref:Predicted periplasmic lipoprotein n=1 Tax=Hahella chejuensis (strain KCTC 2396) TaxID=349521 RepID=Q2SQH5_HAHCH|nr:imelysin family protein [Hahella chejuensis]ABC27099.1 predicted periplasmic lipoprotein [Hahella chejuensis KCTC 2396]